MYAFWVKVATKPLYFAGFVPLNFCTSISFSVWVTVHILYLSSWPFAVSLPVPSPAFCLSFLPLGTCPPFLFLCLLSPCLLRLNSWFVGLCLPVWPWPGYEKIYAFMGHMWYLILQALEVVRMTIFELVLEHLSLVLYTDLHCRFIKLIGTN